jgi:hypothetical protein
MRSLPEPEEEDPHHVPLPWPSRTPDPDLAALRVWASEAVAAGVDGLMLYDGHLGIGGEGLPALCVDLRILLD